MADRTDTLKALEEGELELFDELCRRQMPGSYTRTVRNDCAVLLGVNVLIAGTTAGLFATTDLLQIILLLTAPGIAVGLFICCLFKAEAAAQRIRQLLIDVGQRYRDFDPEALAGRLNDLNAEDLMVRLHDPRMPLLTVFRAICRFVVIEGRERRRLKLLRNGGFIVFLLATAGMLGIALSGGPDFIELLMRTLYTAVGIGYAVSIWLQEGLRRSRYYRRVEIIRKAYRDPALLATFPDLELPTGNVALKA